MKYECDLETGTHCFIDGSLVCCCGAQDRSREMQRVCFKGSVGELERIINDSIPVEETVM